jgi:hypothetical protein
MFDSAMTAAKRFGMKLSLASNAAMLLLIGFICLGVQTHHIKADIEFPGVSLGGGTSEHAARDQQLAALSNTLPLTSLTPPPVRAPALQAAPAPQRKPVIQQ